MGAIAGCAGSNDEALLIRMMDLVAHRARGGAAYAAQSNIGLASGVDRGRAAQVARVGKILCVIDGLLLRRGDLAKKIGASNQATDAELVARGFEKFGAKIFEHLDGAFAVAVADADVLHVARDPLGEKPVYYARIEKTFLVASEIKSFLAHPKFRVRPNLRSLTKLLVFSFIPGADSMFEDVSELPPGTRLVVHADGRVETHTYWDLDEREIKAPEARFVTRTRELVRDAVEARLGGVRSVAAFLSGGIDSSAVVAILAQLGVSVTAYSASFGHGQPNELAYARLVADHCGVKQQVIDVEPDSFIHLLPEIMWRLDDPLCDCITVPNYVLAREAAKDFEVAFNGEGGDPLFGGPKNKFLILGEWYAFLGNYDRARAYLSSYHKFYDYLESACTADLLEISGGSRPLEELVQPFLEAPSIRHFLNRLMHVNIKLKGGQNILVKVDKMLSAHGIRAASPLFDRALTEYSFHVPPRLKRKGDVEKYVFKKAMEDALPRVIVYRKKAGMGVPLNHWFKVTRLRDYAQDLLLSQRARERGLFQRTFVENLLGGHGPTNVIGKNRSGELLWMLLAIELWHRVYVDGERPS